MIDVPLFCGRFLARSHRSSVYRYPKSLTIGPARYDAVWLSDRRLLVDVVSFMIRSAVVDLLIAITPGQLVCSSKRRASIELDNLLRVGEYIKELSNTASDNAVHTLDGFNAASQQRSSINASHIADSGQNDKRGSDEQRTELLGEAGQNRRNQIRDSNEPIKQSYVKADCQVVNEIYNVGRMRQKRTPHHPAALPSERAALVLLFCQMAKSAIMTMSVFLRPV